MIFRQVFLEGIRTGSVTLAFRRWRRPTVRAGGTLLTSAGQLEIRSVSRVSDARISNEEARQAGFESRDALLAELNQRSTGEIYRVELGVLRPDPRIGLRDRLPEDADTRQVLSRLHRLDTRAGDGAWTARVLEILARHPGVRAGDICALAGMAKEDFKVNVRKLKALGLTESLETGYRLSPRGEAIRASSRPRRP